MIGKEETTITDRWFQAYGDLYTTGRVSQRQMCRDLGTDRRNFSKLLRDHSHCILRAEWLAVLVVKYGCSADWLLTGRGWPWG